jgi:glycosyltransferase involved in cell wall biosynthesis
MKILYLNHNYKGQGTYFRAFNFARSMAALGHDISLFTMSTKNNFTPASYMESGVRILESPKFMDMDGGGWAPLDLWHRIFHCIGNKYDLVHAFAHKPTVYFPALTAKFFHRNSIFFADWDDWWGKGGINAGGRIKPEVLAEGFLEEDIIKKADYVTATSIALKKRALGLGVKTGKLFHVPSGCDINRIKPRTAAEIRFLKKKLSIPPDHKIMEFIGFGQADLGIVIDGFIEVKKKIKNTVLIIVGPLEKRWQQKINSIPREYGIIITGKVAFDAVSEYAAIADICYMPLSDTPANRGRGPIKAGDYMAAGKPVIANPVGDIAEWIKKYKIGITADYSGESIAEKTLYLFKRPGLMKKLGSSARKTAENVLSWEIVSKKLEKIYSSKVKKHG